MDSAGGGWNFYSSPRLPSSLAIGVLQTYAFGLPNQRLGKSYAGVLRFGPRQDAMKLLKKL